MQASGIVAIYVAAIAVVLLWSITRYLRGKPEKKTRIPARHPLSGMKFKDNMAFFDYQCQYGKNVFDGKSICYGLVALDATNVAAANFGPAEPGHQILSILLATSKGDQGPNMMAPHNGNRHQLKEWDLVACVPTVRISDENYSGVIIAKCAPEFVDHGVKVLEMF